MARKIKSTKTPEQRRAELEEMQQRITDQVEKLRDSQAWKNFLTFAQSFHKYSLNNLLLIQAQRPDAVQVAGYRKWQELGRQVRGGETGIKIFGGRSKKITETNKETGEEEEKSVMRFFPVRVFDISQTDKKNPDQDCPGELTKPLAGEDPAGIFEAVTDYLTAEGWTVETKAIRGGVNGYMEAASKTVAVDETLSPAHAAHTLLHEAAHVVLHADEPIEEYIANRGKKETEAESVAFIVAGAAGLDTSDYSIGYVAGWSSCDAELIKETAANVLKAAKVLCEGIMSDAEEAAA